MGAPATADRTADGFARDGASADGLRVETHDLTADHLARLGSALDSLAAADPAANPFFSAMMGLGLIDLRSARSAPPARSFEVWCGNRLVAFLPVERVQRLGRLPFPHYQSVHWRHRFLAEPLIDPGVLEPVCAVLLTWLGQAKPRGLALSLPLLRRDGAFRRTLHAAAVARGIAVHDVRAATRPAMIFPKRINQSFDDYLGTRFSAQSLKKLRAKRRKLSAMGPLRHERLARGHETAPWFDLFLTLEHESWKGEGGTSILADPVDGRFFRGMVKAAHNNGTLVMTRTVLGLPTGDRPLAMSLDIRQGDHQYALKIAYDNAFAAYSPGVLHEIENVRGLWEGHRTSNAEAEHYPSVLDSCAAGDHPVLSKLYADTIALSHLMISPAPGLAGLPLNTVIGAKTIRSRLQARSAT
ncbi:MAG: GNAT family N-acetyltransferase [Pseudomonadota bacterium]